MPQRIFACSGQHLVQPRIVDQRLIAGQLTRVLLGRTFIRFSFIDNDRRTASAYFERTIMQIAKCPALERRKLRASLDRALCSTSRLLVTFKWNLKPFPGFCCLLQMMFFTSSMVWLVFAIKQKVINASFWWIRRYLSELLILALHTTETIEEVWMPTFRNTTFGSIRIERK